MPTIEKRTTETGTSYRVKVRLRGQPVQTATFPRLSDAKRWAEQTATAIREGRYFAAAEARKHTLNEAIERYRREHLPTLRDPRNRDQHLRWWSEQAGALTLADVTAPLINEHLQRLTEERPRAAQTIAHYRIAIVHLLNIAAREWGWMEVSPAGRVKRIKVQNARVRFLSDDELSRLLAATKGHADLHLFVMLALSTGARRGELLSLTWEQIDITRRSIRLNRTKNGDQRTLPLAEAVLPLLTTRPRPIGGGLVFASRQGRVGRPTNLRNAWLAAVKAAGIEDFRVHDLRHTAASWLVQQGVSLLAVAELLGHRTLQMTKRYSHLAPEHLHEVAAKLDRKLGQ